MQAARQPEHFGDSFEIAGVAVSTPACDVLRDENVGARV